MPAEFLQDRMLMTESLAPHTFDGNARHGAYLPTFWNNQPQTPTFAYRGPHMERKRARARRRTLMENRFEIPGFRQAELA